MDQLAEATAAAVGGSFSAFAVYPIEVVKTRLQSTEVSGKVSDGSDQLPEMKEGGRVSKEASNVGMAACAKQVLQEQGIAGFYKGVPYAMFQSSLGKFFYYVSTSASPLHFSPATA